VTTFQPTVAKHTAASYGGGNNSNGNDNNAKSNTSGNIDAERTTPDTETRKKTCDPNPPRHPGGNGHSNLGQGVIRKRKPSFKNYQKTFSAEGVRKQRITLISIKGMIKRIQRHHKRQGHFFMRIRAQGQDETTLSKA
jgi:hypothetical protein